MATITVADLSAEIKLRDERFKSELRGIQRDVDRKTDRMVRDFKKVERGGISAFKRLAKGAAGALIGIGAFFAARGLFRGFKTIVSLASDTTESMNKVKEVFGKAAPAVVLFSQKAATALGASTQEALAMTGEIGNLLVAMGATEEVAGEMSTKIVQLSADLGSFNNVPTTDALNAIRAALIGETEPMRRFGSNVSAARIQTLAMSRGINKAVLATNELMKSQLRLEVIFNDTKKAQGDFNRTADDFANLMKALEGLIANAGAKLGIALIPMLEKFAEKARDFMTGVKFDIFIDNLAKKFGVLANAIGGAVTSLIEWINRNEEAGITVKEQIGQLLANRKALFELTRNLGQSVIEISSSKLDLISKILGRDAKPTIEDVNKAIKLTSSAIKELVTDVREGRRTLDEPLIKPNKKPSTSSGGTPSGTGGTLDGFNEQAREARAAILNIAEANNRLRSTAEGAYVDPLDLYLKKMDEANKKTDDLRDGLLDAAGAAGSLVGELQSGNLRLSTFLALLSFIPGPQQPFISAGAAFTGGAGFAHGGGGIVPSGFPQDSFGVGLSSGERVNVETPFQANANDRTQGRILGSLNALNANISNLSSRQDVIEANVNIEPRGIHLMIKKQTQRESRFF